MIWPVVSPDGELVLELAIGAAGTATYSVRLRDALVIAPSRLGLVRDDQAFTAGMVPIEVSPVESVDDAYELVHGKRRSIRHQARQRVVTLRGPGVGLIEFTMRVANDGVAFRYRFPEHDSRTFRVTDELTTFNFAHGGRAWIQPTQPAALAAPAYEELYANGIAIGHGASIPSWNMPALFQTGDHWVLLAEADLGPGYFGGHLGSHPHGWEYRIVLPQVAEGGGVGEVQPESALPWQMPWRVIMVGDDLAAIVESSLVTSLSTPSKVAPTGWIRPGRVSWSWWSDHNSPRDLDALRTYVDLAVEFGWEHTLIDANWQLHDEAAIRALVAEAAARGVGVFLWYNSGGPHNHVPEQPRDRMVDTHVRRAEMARLAEWGVAGIKVDFFHSDKQAGIELYLSILRDAAEYELMVNFHGSTVPRGWERTWPHLMAMEAVAGAEQYAFRPEFPTAAPPQNTILPFTRNVVGAMDYTPVTIGDQQFPHLTTAAHELALAVVFESGLLHLADSAASYRSLPAEVRDYLSAVPAAWDETRLVDGEPGRYVVMARRNGDRWFVAGINGTGEPLPVDVALDFADPRGSGVVIADGEGRDDVIVGNHDGDALAVTLAPCGGFVLQSGRVR